MPERRYDEDEIRSIFDEASRVPTLRESGSAPSTDRGFTLAELQEIGSEAGLDPRRIAEAARALDARPADMPARRRMAGLPIGVSRSVDLGADFDDDDWNNLVVDLRETFDARGRIREQGAFREWSNGNLQALVEPMDGGYRLRMRTVKGSAYRLLGMGAVGIVMALFMMMAFVSKGSMAEDWLVAAFMGVLGIGAISYSALQLPGWARTRERQMEDVAARTLLRARGEG